MVALPLLILFGFALHGFLGTDEPRQRYAALKRPAAVLFKGGGPIDFAILGTSRSIRAIDEAVVAAAVKDESGAAPLVENLAHPWQADGQNYRLLQDLFSRRPVRRAVLYEISRTQERRPFYYHYLPAFPGAVTFRDLLDDFASKPREPRLSRARDLLELLLRRVDLKLTQGLRDRGREAWGWTQVEGLRRGIRPPPERESRPQRLMRREEEIEAAYGGWDRAPATRWPLDEINEDRSDFYLRKTVSLCREHQVPLVFFHAPGYLDPPLSEETRREFRERFGRPLLTPPREVLARLGVAGAFVDPNHMSPQGGRPIYSAWLAAALRDQLQAERR